MFIDNADYVCIYLLISFQGNYKQKTKGDRCFGTKFRQFKSAAVEGTAG